MTSPAPPIDPLVTAFAKAQPDTCAHIPISTNQKIYYFTLFAIATTLLFYRWDYFLTLFNLLLAGFYFSVIGFRLFSVCLSKFGHNVKPIPPEDIAALNDDDLPMYTILIPLYGEANIASKIVKSLDALDYPKDKLDIKILLESDDTPTIDAARACNLPEHYEIIVVPDCEPKTKPRACNHGLLAAKGEFCVIYDAEDRPETDQLKKAIVKFRQAPDNVACLQAKLNYFNPKQNLLTRWFTIEYSAWFDMFLPGLERMGVPIPLGGTSNHFRTRILHELDGWDPFNVTEDCDLGIRIHAKKYRTQLIDSTTWEEANSQYWNWIRQRSRWIKGYFQTHLAHMRHPFKTVKALGIRGSLGFSLCVGGLAATLTLNIIYWIVAGLYAYLLSQDINAGSAIQEIIAGDRHLNRHAWQMIFVGPQEDPFWSTISVVFFIISLTLIAANILFILINCLACIRRKNYGLIPQALISPLYWILISIAAWKGLWQLFTRPFYWEKTVHGLEDDSTSSQEMTKT